MKKDVNIYYGMSGSLKSSYIKVEKNKSSGLVDVMKSGIKFWKNLEKGIFSNYLPNTSNLNYALLHLTRVNDFVDKSVYEYSKLLIERGVTDMLYFHNLYSKDTISDKDIHKIIELEKEIICNNVSQVQLKKILLIQKDRSFVEGVVFNEPTRKDHFVDWIDYENKQNQYVEFTLTHNRDIDEVIVIEDAKDFIENVLKTKYREI